MKRAPKCSICLLVTACVLLTSGGCASRQAPAFVRDARCLAPPQELTIADAHAAMRRGELSAEALVTAYLERIAALDQHTRMNAIRTIDPGAVDRARALDRAYRETGEMKPLHGIPVIVKDNIDVAGLATTAGSVAMRNARPPDDAHIIRRLLEAGAVVVAKSNMGEWAFSPLHTTGSAFGVTRNPYDLERVPAGSSGGTAGAVAANFGIIGLGTDTGNSVRGPSAHTALVGLRPSLGVVSRDGIVPLFLHYDTAGPMCRTVADVAAVMDVITGVDPADPITSHASRFSSGAFSRRLHRDSLRGVRVGVLRSLFEPDGTSPEVLRLTEAALVDLTELGAVLVDMEIPNLGAGQDELWCNTFRHDANAYLATLGVGAPFRDVAEMVDLGLYLPYLDERLKSSVAIDVPPEEQDPACLSVDADPRRKAWRDHIVSHMDSAAVEVMVFPTWAYPPRRVGDLETPHGNNSYQIAPHTGFPAITVPMGETDAGLPAGLQFLGRRFSDVEIVTYAYAFEQHTQHRRAARFPPADVSGTCN